MTGEQPTVPGPDGPVGALDGLAQPPAGYSDAAAVTAGGAAFAAGIGWAAAVHHLPAWASVALLAVLTAAAAAPTLYRR